MVCIDDEIPFEIPNGWEWCRLGQLCTVFGRIGFRGYTKADMVQEGKGAISISPSNMNDDGSMHFHSNTYISWFKYDESPEIKIRENDILVVKTGSSYGKTCVVPRLPQKATINPQIAVLKYIGCNNVYLSSVLSSPNSRRQFERYVLGTSIPTFSQERLSSTIIPLPPLSEQNRIVDLLKTMQPLVNQYNKLHVNLEELNASVKSVLRKSILQEAIQGKLVAQDASDEPASVLLQRIREEKERLVKEGKLKKKDVIDSTIFRGDDNKYFEKKGKEIACIDDEIPFEIPESWQWCRVKQILDIGSARRVHQKDWRSSGVPFYRAREIGKLAECGHVDNELFIDYNLYKEFSSSGVPMPGDLMVTAVGTLGKVYIVKDGDLFYYKDGSVLCLNNRYNLNPSYLKCVIESPMFINQFVGESQGTTVATLTMVRFNEYLIPVPPLREQERIVKAIDYVASTMSR